MSAASHRRAPAGPDLSGRFPSADGTSLYGEWYAPKAAPRATAVVVHGLGEHAGRYRETAGVLTDAGLSVLAFDLRGHGRADGQRGYVRGFREYLDDLDGALAEVQRRNRTSRPADGSLPVVLVAHSNGALVALRALTDATRAPAEVIGLAVSSPFLGLAAPVPPLKQMLGRVAGRYAPTLSLATGLPLESLTHDLDKLAARRADSLCHDVATARWFTAAERAQRFVRQHARSLEVPSLWLVAGGDRVADPASTRAVHQAVRAPSRYREFPGMHHEVFNEVGRAQAFDLLREFVAERLKSLGF